MFLFEWNAFSGILGRFAIASIQAISLTVASADAVE